MTNEYEAHKLEMIEYLKIINNKEIIIQKIKKHNDNYENIF